LKQVQEAVKEDNIILNLVDVASPVRDKTSPVAKSHDNLAVIDLVADQRVALPDTKVQFTVSVFNYGATEPQRPPYLRRRANGEVDKATSTQSEKAAPGKVTRHTFELSFPERKLTPAEKEEEKTRKGTPPTLEEKERRRRLDRQFFHIQVDVGKED